jgi:hypothetical protein
MSPTDVDDRDRYLAEEVKPRPRTCRCPKFTPTEDAGDSRWRCLWCGRPHPKTEKLQAQVTASNALYARATRAGAE